MESVKLTEEIIEAGKSDVGGWTRLQILALGMEWPTSHGWKRAAVGKLIEKSKVDEFLALRNTSKRMARRKLGGEKLKPQVPGIEQMTIGQMVVVEIDGKSFVIRRTA